MARRSILALALAAALLCGCTPQPPEPAPPAPPPVVEEPTPTAPTVQVDWSKLERPAPPVQPDIDGGRWYTEYTDHLIPRSDYGLLYPYVGTTVVPVQTWVDDKGQTQTWVSSWANPVYGLMTRDGKLVTDPVYSQIIQPTHWENGEWPTLPVLLLSQSFPEEDALTSATQNRRYAVAALDGSWCTGFDYFHYACQENDLLLLSPRGIHRMNVLTRAEKFWSWEELEVSQERLPRLIDEITWMYGFSWIKEGVFLGFSDPNGVSVDVYTAENWEERFVQVFDPHTGVITILPVAEWDQALNAYWEDRRQSEAEWQYATPETIELSYQGNTYTFPVPSDMEQLSLSVDIQEDLVLFHRYMTPEQAWLFRLSTGELVTQDTSIYFLHDSGDPNLPAYIQIHTDDGDRFYNEEFDELAFFPSKPNIYYSYTLQDGLLSVSDGSRSFAYYDLAAGECIFYRGLTSME